MKKFLAIFSTIISVLILSSCSNGISQEKYNALQEKYNALQSENESLKYTNRDLETEITNLEKELNDLKSDDLVENNEDIIPDNQPESDKTDSSSYNDMSDGPSELELMTYAQTVLDDFLPDCKYSHRKDEYNFIKTNLRYKIEGEVTSSNSDSPEDFYMIIEFINKAYETYDLISLQVGDTLLYKASNTSSVRENANDSGILTEENTRIYNEVLEKLNEDYDRDENEVFEEIAPDYNMTGTQLKEFMKDYMEAYYQ